MPAVRTSNVDTTTNTPRQQPGGRSGNSKKSHSMACATCKQRRVKCDRRDGSLSTCTECAQRGFVCVDSDRAPKLLRRGRKIQELELTYGIASGSFAAQSQPPSPASAGLQSSNCASPIDSEPAMTIKLQPAFFTSDFFRWLYLQFPLLDPHELSTRLTSSTESTSDLALISKVLLAWATSFGHDEYGREVINVDVDERAILTDRKDNLNAIVADVLATVDRTGVLRRVTWDGTRAVLLLVPLTKDLMPAADREIMYGTALLQAYRLVGLAESTEKNERASEGHSEVVRARLFWYTHVHEAIHRGVREGSHPPLLFNDASVASFKTSLSATVYQASLSQSPITSGLAPQHSMAPIRVASTCRLIRKLLVCSPSEEANVVDAGVKMAWAALDASWAEFEQLRMLPSTGEDVKETESTDVTMTDVFATSWQVFVFEAHHAIRDKLSQLLVTDKPGTPPSQIKDVVSALREVAEASCRRLVPDVLKLVRRHLQQQSPLFKYEASGLLGIGVFHLGKHLVEAHQERLVNGQPDDNEDFQYCVTSLQRMSSRWAYSEEARLADELLALWTACSAAPSPEGPTTLRSGDGGAMSVNTGGDFGMVQEHPAAGIAVLDALASLVTSSSTSVAGFATPGPPGGQLLPAEQFINNSPTVSSISEKTVVGSSASPSVSLSSSASRSRSNSSNQPEDMIDGACMPWAALSSVHAATTNPFNQSMIGVDQVVTLGQVYDVSFSDSSQMGTGLHPTVVDTSSLLLPLSAYGHDFSQSFTYIHPSHLQQPPNLYPQPPPTSSSSASSSRHIECGPPQLFARRRTAKSVSEVSPPTSSNPSAKTMAPPTHLSSGSRAMTKRVHGAAPPSSQEAPGRGRAASAASTNTSTSGPMLSLTGALGLSLIYQTLHASDTKPSDAD